MTRALVIEGRAAIRIARPSAAAEARGAAQASLLRFLILRQFSALNH